jgi:amidase
MKFLRRILPLALATIALTLATHAVAIPPPPEGPARSYPTEFPLSEPDYTSKRLRDFSPFEQALANFSAEQRSALDALVLEATIPQLQQLMASGDLTAEELVVYYLDRIRRYDVDQLNSVMELNPDALEIARNLDVERAEGNLWGPLHGIPVLLKDNIIPGDQMHTTAGAYALKDWRGDRDAQLVKTAQRSDSPSAANSPSRDTHQGIFDHSMGGYGALAISLRNPGRFKSVSAFASTVAPSQVPWGQKTFRHYLGDKQADWFAYDPTYLFKAAPE